MPGLSLWTLSPANAAIIAQAIGHRKLSNEKQSNAKQPKAKHSQAKQSKKLLIGVAPLVAPYVRGPTFAGICSRPRSREHAFAGTRSQQHVRNYTLRARARA